LAGDIDLDEIMASATSVGKSYETAPSDLEKNLEDCEADPGRYPAKMQSH